MLTDPISDYLTRIRNALAADHTAVEMPASRLKKELSRILREQGYINGFEVEPTAKGEVIRIELKYTDDRRPVISGMRRVSRPGRRRYVAQQRRPARPGRHGHLDHLHLLRRDDRPRGQGEGRRRRSRRLRLVTCEIADMSRIGNKPIQVPEGVTVDVGPAA